VFLTKRGSKKKSSYLIAPHPLILEKFNLQASTETKVNYKQTAAATTAVVAEKKVVAEAPVATIKKAATITGESRKVLKQRKGRISIKDFANSQTKELVEAEEELSIGTAEAYFSLDMLQKAWNSFSYEIEKHGKTMAAHTLRDNTLKLSSNFRILFPLHSKSQVNIFNGVKIELTNVLRKKLNNFKINIDTPIESNGEVQKKFMTAEERFKKICEEKPDILQMKKLFGLDFE